MEYRVEDRIKEKSERADHNHYLERHYKKDDDTDTGTNLRYSFLKFVPQHNILLYLRAAI